MRVDEGRTAAAGAVDLDHLAAQTMGDAALAREVLGMFDRQSAACLTRLADPSTRTAETAHLLLGSARGIGAREVARLARLLEDALGAGGDGAGELARLRLAVDDARAFIAAHLAAGG